MMQVKLPPVWGVQTKLHTGVIRCMELPSTFVECTARVQYTRERDRGRSEEHTSELQSRFELVWRLLLEKKNGPAHYQRSCCYFPRRCCESAWAAASG